jgi:hypothetical protein
MAYCPFTGKARLRDTDLSQRLALCLRAPRTRRSFSLLQVGVYGLEVAGANPGIVCTCGYP